jgi:hypothetical protein
LQRQTVCWWGGLAGGALQIGTGGVRSAALEHLACGGAQPLDDPLVAAWFGCKQMWRKRDVPDAVLREQSRGAFVVCRARGRRKRVVHGRAHDRMDELERAPVAHNACRGQHVRGLDGNGVVLLCERCGVAKLGAATKHRQGARQVIGCRPQPSQARERRQHDRRGRDLLDPRDARIVRDDVVALKRPQQLMQQERVAARGHAAGVRELLRARPVKQLFDQQRDRGLSEDRWAQHGAHQLGLGDRRQRAAGTLADTRGVHNHDRKLRHARRKVGDKTDRRGVRPLRVIDGDQQRLLNRQVRRQPIQPMQDRARFLPGSVTYRHRRQDRGGQTRGTRQPAVPIPRRRRRQQHLKQLTHDSEGELALKLTTPRPQHTHPGRRPTARRIPSKRRLADPRLALDRHHGPHAIDSGADRPLKALKFALALQQPRGRQR